MINLLSLVEEAKKDKDKEKKIVFVETDPTEPFPNDTITHLEKEINKKTKDLEIQWSSAIELLDAAFKDLDVPKPSITQKERWAQYCSLIAYTVKNLYDSRGFKASWTTTI